MNVPPELVGRVVFIHPGGLACAAATISPTPGLGTDTTFFQVEPTQTGPCTLDLAFEDGTTFSTELTVIETTGCCAGLRTTPPSAAEIDLPAPATADSGS